MQWNYTLGCVPPNKVSNVFIAAFTTAYAHLKMYAYLKRILYTDINILIYVVKDGEAPLELDGYLGPFWLLRDLKKLIEEINFYPQLCIPFSCLIVGPSGCGKNLFYKCIEKR